MNGELDINAFFGSLPVNDFEGFSRIEMHNLLYYTFESEKSSLRLCSDMEPRKLEKSKFLNDIVKYLNMLGDRQPIKLTRRGNLPRAFCRELVGRDILEADRTIFDYKKIWSEEDSYYISLIDILMDLAGLTKKRHGKKTLTKRSEKYLKSSLIDLFLHIFKVFARKFNWAYSDYYPDSWIIQGGFAFSIFLVQKYGDEERKIGFYSDKFKRAFPAVIGEFSGSSYLSPGEEFHHCYSVRTFESFLLRFGLVEIETDLDGYKRKSRVKKTDLVDEFIKWSWFEQSH